MGAIRAVVRQLDLRVPYRMERQRQQVDESEDPLVWTRAPLATACYTIFWQVAVLTATMAAVLFGLLGKDAESEWGSFLLVCIPVLLAALFLGVASEVRVYVRAFRRRKWTLLLTGIAGLNALRGLEYAVDPRPRVRHMPNS